MSVHHGAPNGGKKLILSLCDKSGNWPSAYAEDPAYEVRRYDISDGPDFDVRLLPRIDAPVHGILAAPPCTHFSVAGAASWKTKGDAAVIEGMQVVDACLRVIHVCQPKWWALENPSGRLSNWIGRRAWTFQPCEYGGYLLPGEKSLDCPNFPAQDAYTKKTNIWGTAIKPVPRPVPTPKPFAGQARNAGGNRWNNRCFQSHRDHRSVTPLGFARAFKDANP